METTLTGQQIAARADAFSRFLDMYPDADRKETYRAFMAGWDARTSHATSEVFDDPDVGAVHQILNAYRDREANEITWVLRLVGNLRQVRRENAALTAMMETADRNPADAPLHRRIGEQRRQIRELHRVLGRRRELDRAHAEERIRGALDRLTSEQSSNVQNWDTDEQAVYRAARVTGSVNDAQQAARALRVDKAVRRILTELGFGPRT